jgi:hypothetical protein
MVVGVAPESHNSECEWLKYIQAPPSVQTGLAIGSWGRKEEKKSFLSLL